MGEHADDAIFAGLDGSWGWGGRGRGYSLVGRRTKKTNQQIFKDFAGPVHGHFKTGQRVVHVPSGVAGVILATRAFQVCWRPDTRIRPGGIWIDPEKLRSEDF